MPVDFGAEITSASYDVTALQLTINGSGFAENQYGGTAWISYDGGLTYNEADVYDSWSDKQIVITFLQALPAGSYYIKVITGDNVEVISSASIFIVTALLGTPTLGIAIMVGI